MRNPISLTFILIVVILTSCKHHDQEFEYVYPASAELTWGYAQFYGDYYSDMKNANNVVSLSLFSDSLKINDEGKLEGFGQYIFLEDIFSAPNDTILPEGTYYITDTIRPYAVAKGEIREIDGLKYTIGAQFYFIEKNSQFSKVEAITGGKFTVNYVDSKCYMMFNFVFSDSTKVSGRLNYKTLPYFNESVNYPAGTPRNKLKFKTEVNIYSDM